MTTTPAPRPRTAAALGLLALAAAPASGGEPPVAFARDVLPILSDACFHCHGPDPATRKAGLRLDTREGALRTDAPVVVPGKSAASELYRRVASPDAGEVMPPPEASKKLTPAQVATLKRWIDQGAAWGRHWAFEPPTRPPVPVPRDPQFTARNPIDAFILARLEKDGLTPSPVAPRETLLRRLSLDLTGLPPTPAKVDAFLADRSPDAYEKVVDHLLGSPRYGEHMARDWLDQARYADTHGYFTDHARSMWRWRDWVIDAYNRNLSFDRFTVEQLAGDLLPGPTVGQRIATGFNRNHMITEETGVIPEEYRAGYVADRVRTTAAVWMGLTVGCAQCHDHKFDPLTQREFFQLFAFFNNLPEKGIDGGRLGNAGPVLAVRTPEQERDLAAFREGLKAVEGWHRFVLASPPLSFAKGYSGAVVRELREAEKRLQAAGTVMVMEELSEPRDTFVMVRGQYDQLGEKVRPGVPAFLPPLPPDAPANRLGLARWLVDPKHPLTARVAVNRLWRQLFGRGLVATVEDFGVRGEPPTHPALLDWLAAEFVESGWDVKRLQRLIVTSATYRQSSNLTPALAKADPENRLLARAPRYRLDAEAIRDSALSAGGLLVEKAGGPSVKPYQPAGVWNDVTYDKKNTQHYDQATGEGLYRRSLYTFWKRQLPPPAMWQLDAPTRETCSLRRQRTNTPLQALVLLNDTQFVEAARGLARRVLAHPGGDRARIDFAFRLALARRATDAEAADLRPLLAAGREQYRTDPDAARKLLRVGESPVPAGLDPAELAAWTLVGNALLNLDEAITRE